MILTGNYRFREFANGCVYALKTHDNFVVETTDTFLPFYTKDAIGRKQNFLENSDLGDRSERWMIGVSVQSGCPVSCKFCLLPDTKITMSDFSIKLIKDINLFDDVLSNILTENSNDTTSYATKYYKTNKVTELFKRYYSGKIIKIELSNGTILELTPNHKIAKYDETIYRNKYYRADELNVGDKVFCSENNQNHDLHSTDAWIIGWLYGFIKGDSVYTKNTNRTSYKTTVSQSNDLINYAHSMINKYFGKTTKISEYDDGDDNHNISYTFSFGETTFNNMNDIISKYECDKDYKKGFIAGFWDAEGFSFKNNKMMRVCNTNIDFLNMFNQYLIDLGFNSGKIKKYESNGTCMILESGISRFTFNRIFSPLHTKRLYLHTVDKIKNVCDPIEIISINSYDYEGYVYNFATETHTYIANNILVHNCATGQLKKCRNLSAGEIVEQVNFIQDKHSEDFNNAKEHKINYTRMGDTFLNLENVQKAIKEIDKFFPNTHHFVSTIGIRDRDYSWITGNITLQISLHAMNDEKRNWLIPYKNKMSIKELGQIRTNSNLKTTINLTLVDESDFDIDVLKEYFDPKYFFVKLSPINPGVMTKLNNLGKGVIEGINLK